MSGITGVEGLKPLLGELQAAFVVGRWESRQKNR